MLKMKSLSFQSSIARFQIITAYVYTEVKSMSEIGSSSPMSPTVPLNQAVHAAGRKSWAQEICWGTGFNTPFASDSSLTFLYHVNKSLNIE